jgi:hypothetical protein
MESAFSACFGGIWRTSAAEVADGATPDAANERETSLQRADACEDLEDWLVGSMASLSCGGDDVDEDGTGMANDGGLYSLMATAASAGIDTPTPSLDHAEMDLDNLPSLPSLDLDVFFDAGADLDMNEAAEAVQAPNQDNERASQVRLVLCPCALYTTLFS